MNEISGAPDPDLVLICAAAAERGAVFCRALGRPDQSEWVDASLGLVWAAAAGDPVEDECAEALDDLGMESQDGEDDPSRSDFYVNQSVALVGNALAASLRPSADKAEMAVNTIRSLLSMLDFKLGGEVPLVVRHGDPPLLAGPLVQIEIDAERELLDVLARAAASHAKGERRGMTVDRTREASREFAGRLAPFVEEFASLGNWDL